MPRERRTPIDSIWNYLRVLVAAPFSLIMAITYAICFWLSPDFTVAIMYAVTRVVRPEFIEGVKDVSK